MTEKNVSALISFGEEKPMKTDNFVYLSPTKFSTQQLWKGFHGTQKISWAKDTGFTNKNHYHN